MNDSPFTRMTSARLAEHPQSSSDQRPPLKSGETLARGLIRLDEESADRLPPPMLPQHDPLQSPRESAAAGMVFSQIITAMSAHAAVWSAERLTSASEDLRARGALPQSNAFFYTDLRSMNIISHAIEERVIANRLDCEVYSGFQRLSLLKPQQLRYRALVDTSRYVYVYGLDDLSDTASIDQFHHPRLLRFAVDPRLGTGLEWFWFVVVDAPQLHTALLAQHMDGDLWSNIQNTRRYAGLWTFDVALVRDIIATLRLASRALYYGVPA